MFERRRRPALPAFLLGIMLLLGGLVAGPVQAETVTGSLSWGGLTRTYRLHLPPVTAQTKPMPLIIALHGGGGNGARMERLTLEGFNSLADREGCAVVYPDGLDKHWNDGRQEGRYRAHREKIDDVGFISALIDHLVKERQVDPNRVYVTGISNGAMMSQRLAWELTGKIAAIAPVAGSMPTGLAPCGSPSRPIPVLLINGTADPMVPWTGGEIRFGRLKLGKVWSVAETVKFWVAHNHCDPNPVITRLPHRGAADGTRVRQEVYGGGREGTEVVLYAIEGGGHTWPQGLRYMPEWFVGKTSQDLEANEVIWSFFKRHSLK